MGFPKQEMCYMSAFLDFCHVFQIYEPIDYNISVINQ